MVDATPAMDRLVELARQLGEFTASNAQPAAELAGRVVQASVWSAVIGAGIILALIITLFVLAVVIGNRGDKATNQNAKENLNTSACIFFLASGIFFAIWIIVVAIKATLWFQALDDWRFALAAKVMGVL